MMRASIQFISVKFYTFHRKRTFIYVSWIHTFAFIFCTEIGHTEIKQHTSVYTQSKDYNRVQHRKFRNTVSKYGNSSNSTHAMKMTNFT